MAWTAPMTAVSGVVFLAADFNTYARDNLNASETALATAAGQYFVSTGLRAIAVRSVTPALIATSESTASTTYVDLATVGPTSGSIATSTRAMVTVRCRTSNSTAGQSGYMSWEVSGASTFAADDVRGVGWRSSTASDSLSASHIAFITSLTAGNNTITAKYRATGGTATFAARGLAVMPF